VTRDLAVARELRRLCPEVEIEWIAGHPACEVLEAAGERLATEQPYYRGETDLAELVSRDGRLSLTKYVFRALGAWFHNARLMGKAASRGDFDVVVGNETYEIPVANFFGMHVLPDIPFVMMYDFWGMEVTSNSLMEKLGAWAINLIWSQEWRVTARRGNAAIFFGEIDDVPDRRFGAFLPNRRRRGLKHLTFVGYALPFDVDQLPARDQLRHELGYEDEVVVTCAVGGTSIGRELLELCGRAFPLVNARIPDLHMIAVAGPRIPSESLDLPEGVERYGMIDGLWRHMAASDLAVVQGGGTTTLELEALRVPFLYFPVPHQSEQEITIATRLSRHGAGVRMDLTTASPEELADVIVANVGARVSYKPIPVAGAKLAAQRILECANARGPNRA